MTEQRSQMFCFEHVELLGNNNVVLLEGFGWNRRFQPREAAVNSKFG